jgi:peptidoglycan/xylan/chitin deacetylase (PgdA/CDA1 family)
MSGLIPVLLYHSIADEPLPADRLHTVSRGCFEAHADAIAAANRVGTGVTELADALRGTRPLPERPVVITFDDGFADTYDAVESLLARGLRSSVYVTTGAIGRVGRLAAADVVALSRRPGVELGAHAVRHRRLDELDDRELASEVRDSREALEELTQRPVLSFAYPHGAYDRRVRDAVIAAGYRSSAAVKNAASHLGDDPFAIARWTVTAGTPASRIAEVLDGRGLPRAWRHERLRTRGYRAARRQRRRLARRLGRHDG